MTAAGKTFVRISVLFLASVVVWVGGAEAKTQGEAKAEKAAAQKDEVPPKAKKKVKKKKALEADAIAHLDDLGACGLFEEAEAKGTPRKTENKARRRAAREKSRAASAERSPDIGDLFRGSERSAARPQHREVGYVDRDRLSSRQVGGVMRAHRGQVAHCFSRASRRGIGEVVLHLDVSPEGKVTSVKMAVDGARPRRVRRCLSSRVRSWRFPKADAASSIEFPFVFGGE